MKRFALAFVSTFVLTLSAHAETCKVADPSGTPLNYREAPQGRVLGSLRNGTRIYINDYREDRNGKLWVRAFRESDDKYLGWVYYNYLSCGE